MVAAMAIFGTNAMAGHSDINPDKPGHGYDDGPGEGPGNGNGYGHNGGNKPNCDPGDDCWEDFAEQETSFSDYAGYGNKASAGSHAVAELEGCVNLADPENFFIDFTFGRRWKTGLTFEGTITPFVQADAFADSFSTAFAEKSNTFTGPNGPNYATSMAGSHTDSQARTELHEGETVDKTVTAYIFGCNLGSENFTFDQNVQAIDAGKSRVHVSGHAGQENGNLTGAISWNGIAFIAGGNESDAYYRGDGRSDGWSEANGSADTFGFTSMVAFQDDRISQIDGISQATSMADQSERRGGTKVTGEGGMIGTTYVNNSGSMASGNGQGSFSYENTGHYNTGATGYTTINGSSYAGQNYAIGSMHVQSVVTSAPSIPVE